MSTPTDLQNATSAIQWTNGRGLITGAMLAGLMAIVLSIFSTLGTWSSAGVFTPNIPNGSVSAAMLAPGITANLLGQTGVTAGSYGGAAQSLSATVGSDGRLSALAAQAIALPGQQVTGPLFDSPVPFASLPTSPTVGERVFCTNCLKPGQSAGAGTGMPEFYDGTGWFSSAGTAAAH